MIYPLREASAWARSRHEQGCQHVQTPPLTPRLPAAAGRHRSTHRSRRRGSRGAARSSGLHHLPETAPAPPGCPQAGSSPHPTGGGRQLPRSPAGAPGRLGALLSQAPFFSQVIITPRPGGSGNTSSFPQAPLGIASDTAGLISHAPGFAPPPRRFLPPGNAWHNPGTALAQPRHRSLPPPRPAPAFAPRPGSPGGGGRGRGGGGEMKGQGTGDASIGQSVPCLPLFALR